MGPGVLEGRVLRPTGYQEGDRAVPFPILCHVSTPWYPARYHPDPPEPLRVPPVPPCTTPETRSGVTAGTDLAAFVEDLNARIGLPGSLREMGVPASSIPEMALKAERDHSTATNPRPTTAADYAALLEDSIAA